MAEGAPKNPAEVRKAAQRRGANRADTPPANSQAHAKHDAHHGGGALSKVKGFAGVIGIDFLGKEVIANSDPGSILADIKKAAGIGGGGHGKGHKKKEGDKSHGKGDH